MSLEQRRVLIAGGGPVGLLSALLLGRQGLPVRLFDVNESPQADPRAATTIPPHSICLPKTALQTKWRALNSLRLSSSFGTDRAARRSPSSITRSSRHDTHHPFVVQCEQFKTAKLILERVRKLRNVEVLFGHEVLDIAQTHGSISATCAAPDGVKTHAGAYLIGADGGRSVVRKQSDIAFDGFTWPEHFIVLTTPFDFEAARGLCFRSYFADPDEWCNCFKVSADGSPGLWRTVFPANPDLSEGVDE